MSRCAVVTGAFSYTGAAIAAELLARGWRVRTLTNRRAPAGSSIRAAPLHFDPEHLRHTLTGADTLVNTYWIRLPGGGQTFETAVDRSALLLDAAVAAGVGRLVHVSVSNAQLGQELGYYRGKAAVEARVRALPISRAIVRPTLVVGPGDVLTGNIAWLLRRFPFFPLPAGQSRLQPITLADTARIIADAAEQTQPLELDAAGPEVLTFQDYVRAVARACRVRRPIFRAPAWAALAGTKLVGLLRRDQVLTREELRGLAQELLMSHRPPLGTQSVTRWLEGHGDRLGQRYTNDSRRHFGAGAAEPMLDPAQPSWL